MVSFAVHAHCSVRSIQGYSVEEDSMQSKIIADRDFGMSVALNGLKQRGYSPNVIFDIGAADGAWARLAMSFFPNARMVCFEPLSERIPAMKQLESEGKGKVRFLNVGVGDANVELEIGITEGLYDSSFAYSGSKSRKVSVRTLDTLLHTEHLALPSFVKIDVQGFEKRVIDGGPSVFDHAEMVLMECQFFPFCEDMRTLDQTIGYMSSKGFIPYEFVDLLRRPLDGAMGQCDILFIKRQHKLVSNLKWS
jgi:FkbM family methyltransferase